MNTKPFCRTCLRSSSLLPLFRDSHNRRRYEKALYWSTGLQIRPNDGLPQTICKQCSKHVESAIKFRARCQKAQKRLLKIIHPKKSSELPKTSNDIARIEIKSIDIEPQKESNKNLSDSDPQSILPSEEYHYESSEETTDVTQSYTKVSKNKPNDTPKVPYHRQRTLEFMEGPLKKNQPVQCRLCKKLYRNFNTFEKHVMSHVGYNVLCEFCGKDFISQWSLLRHQRAKHGLEKDNSFPCSFCDFQAIDKEQLEVHQRRVHTKDRPYVCDDCGASFFSKRVLIQHIVNHKDDKPFQCDMCPSKFKLRCTLTTHTKKVHNKSSNSYTYVCHICNKRYQSTSDTRKHLLKIHGIPVQQQGKVHRLYYHNTAMFMGE